MRVMVFVPGDKDSEAGKMPSQELIGKMMKFNEELVKAGVMLDGQGLTPTSKAKRVKFEGTKRTLIDGPFAETREQLGGYYLIDARDLDEAIAVAERIPPARVGTIEIRPVMEIGGLPVS